MLQKQLQGKGLERPKTAGGVGVPNVILPKYKRPGTAKVANNLA